MRPILQYHQMPTWINPVACAQFLWFKWKEKIETENNIVYRPYIKSLELTTNIKSIFYSFLSNALHRKQEKRTF